MMIPTNPFFEIAMRNRFIRELPWYRKLLALFGYKITRREYQKWLSETLLK